jgi:Glu-tRNA(Gln) amidotransferase subunit E-like FAD-binding protein
MQTIRRLTVILGMLTLTGLGSWIAGSYMAQDPEPVGDRMYAESVPPQVHVPASAAVTTSAPPPKPPDNTKTDARLASIEAQLSQLRQQVQTQQVRMQQQQEELKRLISTPEKKAAQRLGDAAAEVETEPASETDWQQARVVHLEAALTAQALADKGSDEAVEQITAAVEQLLEGVRPEAEGLTTLWDAECRTTLCRIEFIHDTRQAMENFLHEFPQRLGWQASAHYDVVSNADGSLTTVMYLSRNGHALPNLSN